MYETGEVSDQLGAWRLRSWVLLCLLVGSTTAFGQTTDPAKAEAKPASAAPPGKVEAKPAEAKPAVAKTETKTEKPAAKLSAPVEEKKPAQPALDPALEALEKKRQEAARKAAEQQKKPVGRNEMIAKPGAKRIPIRNFDLGVTLPFEPVSGQENQRFEKMRRSPDVDARLIEKVAKARVYSLTDSNNKAIMSKIVQDILRDVRNSRISGEGEINQKFVTNYKASLFKFIPDVVENKETMVGARVNALLLATQLHDAETENKAPAIFVRALKDKTQPEGVHYAACAAIVHLEKVQRISVNEEREAVSALAEFLSQNDIQELLLEKVIAALGAIGRPHSGNLAEKAEVAVMIANRVILNPKAGVRLRLEALIAMTRFKVGQIGGWNAELHAVLMAMALRDIVDQSKTLNSLIYKSYLARVFEGLRGLRDSVAAPEMQEFILKAAEVISNGFNDEVGAIDDLKDWINAHYPPKIQRFTSDSPALMLPPKK